MYLLILFVFSLLTPLSSSSSSTTLEDRFIKSIPYHLRQNATRKYVEVTKPLPSDQLTPSCSRRAFSYDFGNTMGRPPVSVLYSPPANCSWSRVVLDFTASCYGEQYDRIAGVWLDGVEILRTSTAEPIESGVSWKVRKDVTRYASLLAQHNITLSVMLENLVNDVYTGVYKVNISLLYYHGTGVRAPLSELPIRQKSNRKLMSLDDPKAANLVEGEEIVSKTGDGDNNDDFELESEESGDGLGSSGSPYSAYETPADLIIPMSLSGDRPIWFRIESEADTQRMGIQIPKNTYKAVLEIYVSFHGNDEFWYSNPPDSYIRMNNLTTSRGNGAYREVFVNIDGSYVGSVIPIPVIFTGGINPLFWEPVVAIGAFDLPSYDVDLTPLLGVLLDGKVHEFEIGVADSIWFWLVDANLHLWLDPHSAVVQAQTVEFNKPSFQIEREAKFKQLDGKFEVEAERKTTFSGWVNSTFGNITTKISQEMEFENTIKFTKDGTLKKTKQKVETEFEVKTISETGHVISRTTVKRKYPITITTSTEPGSDKDTIMMTTNMSHSLKEKLSSGDRISRYVYNEQKSGGWMEVKHHSVVSGAAYTNQSLNCKDEFGCYSRTVAAVNGTMIVDDSTLSCSYFL